MATQSSVSTSRPNPLHVVAPSTPAAPSQAPNPAPSEPTAAPSDRASGRRCPGWLIVSGAIALLGAISLVPIPHNVSADGKLEPNPDKSRQVFMEAPGTVTEFLVRQGEKVAPGQAIAHTVMGDLERDILAKQQELQEHQRLLTQVQQRLPVLQSRLQETQLASHTIQNQAQLLGQRVESPTPEEQQVRQDQAALTERIQRLERDILHLQSQEQRAIAALNRYKAAQAQAGDQGVISIAEIDRKQDELDTLQSSISAKAQEIAELRQYIAGKESEVAGLRKTWQEDLLIRQSQWQETQARIVTAQHELTAAQQELSHLQKLVQSSQQELQTLQTKYAGNQTLVAPQGGLILSADLGEKVGRKMQENEPILVVAQTDTLDVVIEVPQVDAPIAKENALVNIRFRDPGHGVQQVRITEIEPIFKTDATGRKQLLVARAELQNQDGLYYPNQEIRAQILGEKIPLYRKAILEVREHLDWTRFGLGQ